MDGIPELSTQTSMKIVATVIAILFVIGVPFVNFQNKLVLNTMHLLSDLGLWQGTEYVDSDKL